MLKFEEESLQVRFLKPDFEENLPASAKEYDEKQMYKDGSLSDEFLSVSYNLKPGKK